MVLHFLILNLRKYQDVWGQNTVWFSKPGWADFCMASAMSTFSKSSWSTYLSNVIPDFVVGKYECKNTNFIG